MTNKQLLAQIDADIIKATQEMQALRVRIETLREYRNKLAKPASNGVVAVLPNLSRFVEGWGPSKAVRALLGEKPGLDVEAVVKELQGKIKTSATNQERLLRNTILNLVRDGVLRKDENGGLLLN